MLSKHPEACRFPHGHTRRIEIVISNSVLDSNDMVLDFKALKLMVEDFVQRFDHSMAINSTDPLLPDMQRIYPESVVVFEKTDPTTEVLAKNIYDFVQDGLKVGFVGKSPSGCAYTILPGTVEVDRVRVWETPNSWAEYGE